MKKLIMNAIFILILLTVGGIFLLPQLIPLEKLKPEIQAQVKKQIGRDLLIDGEIKVSLWPNISLNLKNVSLSNADWGHEKNLITLDEIDAELKLLPLFSKSIEVSRFILRKPRIYLELNKDGKSNWEFDNNNNSLKLDTSSSTESSESSIPKDFNIKLGEFKITDGVLSYNDHSQKTKYALDEINISIDAKGMNSIIKVKGDAQYRARNIKIDLSADKLASLISMSPFKGAVSLKIEPFAKISVNGQFLENTNKYMTVKMDTVISDINGLMNWASPTGAGEIPFNTLKLSSSDITIAKAEDVNISAKMSDMQIELDDMSMAGSLAFYDKKQGVPYINADLILPEPLDIPKLLNKLNKSNTSEVSTAQVSESSNNDWSDEKIDLSALHALKARFALNHNGFIYKDIKTGKGTALIQLSDGKLLFNMPETSIDKGNISAQFNLQENGAKTKINVDMKANNMAIKPLLKTFADINVLSGIGQVNFKANSIGQSQKSIISNLNGNGGMHLKDGEIEGIDFVNIAQMMQKRLSNIGLGDGGTKFSNFDANFAITKGVVTNKDLHFVGPLVEASGSGNISLPKQNMNYRIIPQMVLKKTTVKDTTTGISKTSTTGLAIPVDIKGAWSNLKIKPDYKALINDVLANPDKLEDVGRTIKNDVKGQIKNIKNLKNIKDNPEQLLKGLFGR